MSSSSPQLPPSQEIIDAQAEIVDVFSMFDDWTDRYQYIIDLGRKLPDLGPADKVESNRLKGCQSQVWMVTENRDGRLHYDAISDSAIVSGLIALMLKVYSDRRPAEIIATPPDFVKQIELEEHLSPTRSNGLAAMVRQIRQFAVEALAAEHAR
ncbi:MAG: SufE family protein [Gammaproteobacteria bacterium]|jgi:cysteine desulfuration protein SufE|nr:SufE family protein [Gammaproteobacteria bacterium]